MQPITLLTDFGLQDAYVGILKGAIAQIAPQSPVIDLTHQISPQDLWAAQFNLRNAYPYFPPQTVHLIVVDPGVGTERRGIVVQTSVGYFVAPDNGVLTPVLQQERILAAIALDRPQYWRTPEPSSTFHGRDIFAPIAAYLAIGKAIATLGSPIDPNGLVQLPIPQVQRQGNQIMGMVQYIDHFGNCITNIPGEQVAGQTWSVQLTDQDISGGGTYGDRSVGELGAIVGSHGWVEVVVNQGNAQAQLQWQVGRVVSVTLTF
ncbi:MAG: SAM hydrolase/SAM-dependent halogenase family protein [Spirulinaceae cyanobacterium]